MGHEKGRGGGKEELHDFWCLLTLLSSSPPLWWSCDSQGIVPSRAGLGRRPRATEESSQEIALW